MSKVSIQGDQNGTGDFTIKAPNSNTDRTLTLPDEAGSVLTDVSDISAANLTGDVAAERITGALNATGSAPVYACRAWVNFNGTGTVSIRDSGNVSSITDNGVGVYIVNLSTTMPDTNYSVNLSIGTAINIFINNNIFLDDNALTPETGRFRIRARKSGTTDDIDIDRVFCAVFR